MHAALPAVIITAYNAHAASPAVIITVCYVAITPLALVVAGEVRVVLQEEKHDFFKRDGADVHYITSMSVLDSLVGSSVEIKTLGGKMINIPVNDIVL